MKTALACALFALAACGKAATRPAPTEGPAAPTSPDPTAPAPAAAASAPAASTWDIATHALELDCGPPSLEETTYKAALAAGRAAGKKKSWGTALAAFEAALAQKKGDATALSELAWATLQAGDAGAALELGEQAVSAATDPKLQAASHYNAGRAAEALGDLARARAHYEHSLTRRANPGISERLASLAAPAPRSLPADKLMTVCQKLASVEAVCACLARTPAASLPADGVVDATCEPAAQKGARAQLVIVRGAPESDDEIVPATGIVLVARLGKTWSALTVVNAAPEVNLAETPHMVDGADILGYEERALGDDTLVWVHSKKQSSDTLMREDDVSGEARLTMCRLPAGAGAPRCYKPLDLGAWNYQYSTDGDEERCEVRSMTTYRGRLDSLGRLFVVLAAGVDDGRSGRYQL